MRECGLKIFGILLRGWRIISLFLKFQSVALAYRPGKLSYICCGHLFITTIIDQIATPASVNATVILSQSTSKVSFRLVCASTVTLNGTAQTAPEENKWVRINPNRPVIIKGSAITDSDISSIIAPTLTLDKEAAPAEAAGANISLGVTSNMDWTAASDSDWTTVTPASGTASASASSLAVAVEENTSAEERTAKVTVTATYGNATVSKTLTITQAGKTEGETPEPEPEQFSLNTVWDLDTATDDFAESEGAYKEAGDHGKYINATTGSGKLTYVQVDKTGLAEGRLISTLVKQLLAQ